MALFGRDPGYSPTLLTWDPNRLYMEERRHSDGVSTLVLTALTRRLLPLVRYDLDDEAELLDAAAANRELMRQGATRGSSGRPWRCGAAAAPPSAARAGACGPEIVKEGLFTTAAHAGALTGRFRIAADERPPGAPRPAARGRAPRPGIEAALTPHDLRRGAGVPAG